MVTCTVKDSVPTTTINFHTFKRIKRQIMAQNLIIEAYPEGEGSEGLFEGQYTRMFEIEWVLKDDATFPSSGDSAADKRADFEALLFSGGDNNWKFRLTFDSEDSTDGSPQTEYYDGYIKNLIVNSISGEMITTITGTFELWESNIS